MRYFREIGLTFLVVAMIMQYGLYQECKLIEKRINGLEVSWAIPIKCDSTGGGGDCVKIANASGFNDRLNAIDQANVKREAETKESRVREAMLEQEDVKLDTLMTGILNLTKQNAADINDVNFRVDTLTEVLINSVNKDKPHEPSGH